MKATFAVLVLLASLVAGCGGKASHAPTPPPSAAPSGKSWVRVITMTGSTVQNSPVFQLQGGQQAVDYTLDGTGSGDPHWGFQIATPSGLPVSNTTFGQVGAAHHVDYDLSLGAGTYRLQVDIAVDCTYTATLWEIR